MSQRKLFTAFAIILLISFVVLSLANSIARSLSNSTDFHSYWHAGLFVIQGSDPYEASFRGQEPKLPIYHIDGKTVSSYPITQPNLGKTPANTASFILLSTLFSFFSWQTAKILWLIINTLIILVIPWMAIRLWPQSDAIGFNAQTLFIVLPFWSYVGTRDTIDYGQTSGVIFALMLLSLLTADKNWMLSGVALGMALSKYSLSLPVFLFLFFFKRNYKVVILSILIQIISLGLLAAITNESPLQIFNGYFRMIAHHADNGAVNITAAIQSPSLSFVSIFTLATFTLAVATPVLFWISRYYPYLSIHDQRISDFHILNILMIWSLLIAYHQEHDTITIILFIILIIYGVNSNLWRFSNKMFLYISVIVTTIWMIRPRLKIFIFLPDQITQFLNPSSVIEFMHRVTTLLLISCLFLTLILLYRIIPNYSCRLIRLEGKEHTNYI